jgi:hypothetical protein
MLLAGCGSKTEAEKQEEERTEIRKEKRAKAAALYKDLATKFPDHSKAPDAASKAKALEAPPAK